jgi:uncharacterized membrane protein
VQAAIAPQARADRPAIRSAAEAITGWLLLALIIGASPGVFLWPTFHFTDRSYLLDNNLPPAERLDLLAWVALSTGALFCFYFGYWVWQRRRHEALSVAAVFRKLNRYTFVLTALPLINLLRIHEIETQQPFLLFLICLTVSAIVASFAYAVSGTLFFKHLVGRWLTIKRGLALSIALGSVYAFCLSRFAIIHHHNFGTATYDLGIYTNVFWHSIHGDLLGCSFLKGASHLRAHFDPLLVLLSPLFLLYPQAETLLVLQSVWLASGVIPLYLIAVKRSASAWFGVILVAAYLLYPALHGPNMYDFHSLSLCVPLLFWCVYLLQISRFRWFWFFFALLLITREDMALLGCALGLYAIAARRAPLLGLFVIMTSIAYLVVAKAAVMTNSQGYVYYFSELRPEGVKGVLGLAWTAITNPVFVLVKTLAEKKLIFLLKLLAPLVFLPLAAGKMWILFAYGFAFTLLASRWAVYDTAFQYSCLLFPFLFVATPQALMRLTRSRVAAAIGLDPRRLFAALACAVCVSSVLVSRSYGVFWENSAFRGGYFRFNRKPTATQTERYRTVKEFRDQIGPEASVISTDRLGPHLAARTEFYRDPGQVDADYLVVWDQELKSNKKEAEKWRQTRKSRKYRLIDEKQGISLFKRRGLK